MKLLFFVVPHFQQTGQCRNASPGRCRSLLVFLGCLLLLTSCSDSAYQQTRLHTTFRTGNTTAPAQEFQIEGLGSCSENTAEIFPLNPTLPVIILVHGCKGSAARFRALAEVFSYHDQQAICFSYNDRSSLMKSSGQLIHALKKFHRYLPKVDMTVIGHSQGGLISRKAFTAGPQGDLAEVAMAGIRLVTISAPFAGIKAAGFCASPQHRILTLGLAIPICKLISGSKLYEITHQSDFIKKPGKLLSAVDGYLKIVTDERNSCRTYDESGVCQQDDFVFTLGEQYQADIDSGRMVDNVQILAGHTEIVGDDTIKPQKLIGILQEKGIMGKTPKGRQEGLALLLEKLY